MVRSIGAGHDFTGEGFRLITFGLGGKAGGESVALQPVNSGVGPAEKSAELQCCSASMLQFPNTNHEKFPDPPRKGKWEGVYRLKLPIDEQGDLTFDAFTQNFGQVLFIFFLFSTDSPCL